MHPPVILAPLAIAFSGMKPGSYDVSIRRTGFEKNEAYTAYLKLGSPIQLTSVQLNQLEALTRDQPELQGLDLDPSGVELLKLPWREYEVILVCLRRRR